MEKIRLGLKSPFLIELDNRQRCLSMLSIILTLPDIRLKQATADALLFI
jgi:hypothetical protein